MEFFYFVMETTMIVTVVLAGYIAVIRMFR